MITEQEMKWLNISADLWNNWVQLETQHSDENDEFKFHLHALQKCMQASVGHRAMLENENKAAEQIKSVFEFSP